MLGASKATTTREYQLLDTGTITSTGSQSYTIPAGTFYLEIELWAGGGGGSYGREVPGRGGSTYYRGGGGGGGSYIKHIYYGAADMQEDDTLNFTVGAGGAKGTSMSDSGDNGGNTIFASHTRTAGTSVFLTPVTAGGGGGGRRPFGFGGGQPNSEAGTATNEGNTTNTNGVAGEVIAVVAGATDDGGDGGAGGNGGAGGAGATTSGVATAGTVPGGGGGGGMPTLDTAGEDGANGKVVVKAYG